MTLDGQGEGILHISSQGSDCVGGKINTGVNDKG